MPSFSRALEKTLHRALAVANDSADVVAVLQLARHLTPTRVHGLREVQAYIRRAAAAHAAHFGKQVS